MIISLHDNTYDSTGTLYISPFTEKTAKPFSRRRLHYEMVKNLVFFNSDEEFL